MGLEIERKFLVRNERWRDQVSRHFHIQQGYLINERRLVTRVRISGDQAFLTLKGETDGIKRSEFEYDIPLEDAEAMLATLSDGSVIEKTRHIVPFGTHIWEVDVFAGAKGILKTQLKSQQLKIKTQPDNNSNFCLATRGPGANAPARRQQQTTKGRETGKSKSKKRKSRKRKQA